MDKIVYIRMHHRIQARPNQTITIGDVAQLVANDMIIQRVNKIAVHQVNMSDRSIVVLDIMQLLKELRKVDPELDIQTFGPAQTIV
jgi:stage V sporulation protein AA